MKREKINEEERMGRWKGRENASRAERKGGVEREGGSGGRRREWREKEIEEEWKGERGRRGR